MSRGDHLPNDGLFRKNVGWTVYILECADGSYNVGMTRNLKRTVADVNVMRAGIYFSKHPERLPAKAVFSETRLNFREALAKAQYMKEMNRKLRTKLIKTGMWPVGGPLLKYILTAPFEVLANNSLTKT